MIDQERVAKLEAQVESIKEDMSEVKSDIKEIHSRITTGNRELMTKFEEKIDELAKNDKAQHETLKNTMEEVKGRVDILERWRWMIVGGAIVAGYLVAHFELISKLFGK